MKFSQLLPVFLLFLIACESPLQTQAESAYPSEVLPAIDTPAPYPNDTPLPPTLPAPVVSSPGIISLHMFNELDGWAIAEDAILRTTDGGYTWYNLSPRGETVFGYGVASAFLNASQAWVLISDADDPVGSGTLYRTSDGGITWNPVPVPFSSMGQLDFVDENHGWMLLDLGAGAGSMGVAILRTSDSGVTWTETFSHEPGEIAGSDSLPLGGLKTAFTPLDENTAWVGGVTYAPETFYFYKTVDGGNTWSPQTITPPPGTQGNDIAVDSPPVFFSPKEAILTFRFMGENFRTGFYVTQDGGVTWEFVSLMPGSGSVDFVSASDGFFWTGEQFFFTEDGAQTWTSVSSDVLFGESFAGMDFVNTHTGWIWTYEETGLRGLYKTTDGGKTWILLDQ